MGLSSSPLAVRYFMVSFGKTWLSSSSRWALNFLYESIFPLTCSFLFSAFSMQSLVYNWGFLPSSMYLRKQITVRHLCDFNIDVHLLKYFKGNMYFLDLRFEFVNFLKTLNNRISEKKAKCSMSKERLKLQWECTQSKSAYIFWFSTLCPCGWKSLTIIFTWRTFSTKSSSWFSKFSKGALILIENKTPTVKK